MESLNRYDRATVALWARSHTALSTRPGHDVLADACAHALLARLRSCAQLSGLFARYDADAAADFALIRSLVPGAPGSESLWRVRDAAFYLRWLELTGGAR